MAKRPGDTYTATALRPCKCCMQKMSSVETVLPQTFGNTSIKGQKLKSFKCGSHFIFLL